MANDRLILVCDECGARIVLFKYYPSPEMSYSPVQGERLTDFFCTHVFQCHPKAYAPELGRTVGFRLLTEALEADDDQRRRDAAR